MRELTYIQALDESVEARRHILLGNGFSIAARPSFRYASLFEEAFGAEDARVRDLFATFQTTDFEQVLNKLDTASEVLRSYPGAEGIAADIAGDRATIATRLIGALTRTHPATSRTISDPQYASASAFLAEMRRPQDPDRAGLIFTTNYDLLLYWTTLRHPGDLQTRDGFGPADDGGLVWIEDGPQSVFHLHGALHLFIRPDGLIGKLRWDDRTLIEQITALIGRDLLPLFVSEGGADQKLVRINENRYLRHALDHFEGACSDEDAVLFVFGSTLNDAHIVDLIINGRFRRIYVSALDVAAARPGLAAKEAEWREERRAGGLPDIEVILFPAVDVAIWQPPER